MLKLIIFIIFSFLNMQSSLAESDFSESGFKIFQTQQNAKILISTLTPLYPKSAKFTARNNTLIVKASPQILLEIEQLLQEIDQPLSNLLIEVSHSFIENKNQQGNHISYDRPNSDIRIIQTRRKNTSNEPVIFKIRTIEGQWAAIQTGKRVPYYTAQKSWNYRWQGSTEFEDVTAGFDVFPTLNGDLVTLKIRPHNNSMNQHNADWINTQSLDTSITGRLGQWIYLGGAATQGNTNNINSGISYRESQMSAQRYSTRRSSELEMDYSIRVNLIE